jgi:hypothetical protein
MVIRSSRANNTAVVSAGSASSRLAKSIAALANAEVRTGPGMTRISVRAARSITLNSSPSKIGPTFLD